VAHTQRHSPGDSTRDVANIFPSEYNEDGHSCDIYICFNLLCCWNYEW